MARCRARAMRARGMYAARARAAEEMLFAHTLTLREEDIRVSFPMPTCLPFYFVFRCHIE